MIKNILLIGFGKMGSAIVKGWTKQNLDFKIYVIEKDVNKFRSIKNPNIFFLKNFDDFETLKPVIDFVLVAVKPQQIENIINNLNKIYNNKSIFISIVAGISSNWFRKNISKEMKIVRAMPNTPASVLKGITGVYTSENITKKDKEDIKIIIGSTGEVVFLKDEHFVDVVTAISGSGPAYFFYLTEVLYKLGIKFGLNDYEATVFSSTTFLGSAELFKKSNVSVKSLRENVTSPGGTTEAALKILMNSDNGLENLFEKALNLAIIRAKKLNQD